MALTPISFSAILCPEITKAGLAKLRVFKKNEFENLKFHFGTSSWGGTRKLPRAFTEQGVAMLSSVLRSRQAVQVNIAIMRTFVKLRQILATNTALRRKIEAIERRYDEQFKLVFKVLSEMVMADKKPKTRIGLLTEAKDHTKNTTRARRKRKRKT